MSSSFSTLSKVVFFAVVGACFGSLRLTVRADEVTLARALDEVENARVHNSPLDDDAYFELTARYYKKLTKGETNTLRKAWGESQQPSISRVDLLKIVVRERALIQTYQLMYELSEFRKPNQATEVMITEKSAGGAHYIERRFVSTKDKATVNRTVLAMSNDVARSYDQVAKAGTIVKGIKLKQFFPPNGILAEAMLLNKQESGNQPSLSLECLLSRDDCYVLHGTVEIEGIKNIRVHAGLNRVFLDVAKNFAVSRLEQHAVQPILNSPGKVRRALIYKRVNKQLEKVGADIWIPRVCEETFYVDNQVASTSHTVLRDVRLNSDIAPATFTSIFPPGTMIQDEIQKKLFLSSESPTVGSSLELIADLERKNAKYKNRWVLYLIGVNIIIFIGFLVMRKALRAKASKS